jgi:T-complex protein 1 subunit gamma
MLAQALPQLERNIHPVVIIQAYKHALADALKIVEEISIPVDTSKDESMISLIESSIGTKTISRYSELSMAPNPPRNPHSNPTKLI